MRRTKIRFRTSVGWRLVSLATDWFADYLNSSYILLLFWTVPSLLGSFLTPSISPVPPLAEDSPSFPLSAAQCVCVIVLGATRFVLSSPWLRRNSALWLRTLSFSYLSVFRCPSSSSLLCLFLSCRLIFIYLPHFYSRLLVSFHHLFLVLSFSSSPFLISFLAPAFSTRFSSSGSLAMYYLCSAFDDGGSGAKVTWWTVYQETDLDWSLVRLYLFFGCRAQTSGLSNTRIQLNIQH